MGHSFGSIEIRHGVHHCSTTRTGASTHPQHVATSRRRQATEQTGGSECTTTFTDRRRASRHDGGRRDAPGGRVARGGPEPPSVVVARLPHGLEWTEHVLRFFFWRPMETTRRQRPWRSRCSCFLSRNWTVASRRGRGWTRGTPTETRRRPTAGGCVSTCRPTASTSSSRRSTTACATRTGATRRRACSGDGPTCTRGTTAPDRRNRATAIGCARTVRTARCASAASSTRTRTTACARSTRAKRRRRRRRDLRVGGGRRPE